MDFRKRKREGGDGDENFFFKKSGRVIEDESQIEGKKARPRDFPKYEKEKQTSDREGRGRGENRFAIVTGGDGRQ